MINGELLNANFVASSSNTLSKHVVLTAVCRSKMCGSQLRVDCCSSQHCVACLHAIWSMQPLVWARQRSLYTHLQYLFMFLFVTLYISKMNFISKCNYKIVLFRKEDSGKLLTLLLCVGLRSKTISIARTEGTGTL